MVKEKGCDVMHDRNTASLRGWQQPQNIGNETYPGLGDPFVGLPMPMNPSVVPSAQPANTTKPGLLSQLGDWKQMLDRVGGIDGVIGAVGKMQKLFSTMQQMAPLLRLLIGKGGAATAAGMSKDYGARRRRARKRKYAGRGAYRPYAGGAGRTRRSASRSPRRRQYPR